MKLVLFWISKVEVWNRARYFGLILDINCPVPDIIGPIPDFIGSLLYITCPIMDITGTIPDINFIRKWLSGIGSGENGLFQTLMSRVRPGEIGPIPDTNLAFSGTKEEQLNVLDPGGVF